MALRLPYLDVEGRVPLVVGEAEELGEEPQPFFPALQYDLSGFRIENIEIVRGLEQADVLAH